MSVNAATAGVEFPVKGGNWSSGVQEMAGMFVELPLQRLDLLFGGSMK
ncbi:MAG: hypothetical protein WCK85_07750 [Chlorobium sp.]